MLAAALESGAFDPRSADRHVGRIGDQQPHHHKTPRISAASTLTTVLAKSSNVGAARVALTMEPERSRDVLTRFGIGRLTDSAFPGESPGFLDGPEALAHGRPGDAVLRIWCRRHDVAARACLRRDRSRRHAAPRVAVRARRSAGGGASDLRRHGCRSDARCSKPSSRRRAPATAPRCAIIHVAGKTGTTRKAGVGGYDADRHGAIFAGFAPATDPRLVVVVMIDEPQGAAYHGGDIAAPVFANIVSGALRVLAVPPDALPAPATDRGRASAGEAMMAARSQRRARTLGDLLGSGAGGYARLVITDLTLDSRAVRPGAAFVALRGAPRARPQVCAARRFGAGAAIVLYEPSDGCGEPPQPSLARAELESTARRARARVLRRGRRADADRRHGHERQDDGRLSARAGA